MTDNNLQKELFNTIKSLLPSHISMVDAVAELLDISYDSVYRRIRGEKPISLDELKVLCEHFNLSLDQVLQLHTDKVLFTDLEANGTVNNFKDYQEGLLNQLKYFNSFKKKELLYLSKDLPVFYNFYFEDLTAFRSFFWSRSILNDPAFENKNFSLNSFDSAGYFEAGQKIIAEYNKIPCIELWNYESINSTISQIEYYKEAGIFESADDLNRVVDSCDAMLQHVQKQAEKGYKSLPDTEITGNGASLKMYVNEIILGNNSILVELDDTRIAIINHVVLKYISTTDKKFTEKTFHNFQNLVSRSVLISGAGERERNKFFKSMREKLQACKK